MPSFLLPFLRWHFAGVIVAMLPIYGCAQSKPSIGDMQRVISDFQQLPLPPVYSVPKDDSVSLKYDYRLPTPND